MRRVDSWPETQATVTNIGQPYNDGNDMKRDFLSVISFTFKDSKGEYYAGRYHMRTRDLPDDLMTGSTITIRYNPKGPARNWCAEDYYRAGLGRWHAYGFPVLMLWLFLIWLFLMGLILIFKSH